MTHDLNKQTTVEWNDLGFYYARDAASKQWRFRGSQPGFLSFCDYLEKYAKDPRNARLSEHDHLGPYMYLKVCTYSAPDINDDGIYGTLENLLTFSRLLRQKLAHAVPGETFTIGREYATSAPFSIVIRIEDQSFRPASADPALK